MDAQKKRLEARKADLKRERHKLQEEKKMLQEERQKLAEKQEKKAAKMQDKKKKLQNLLDRIESVMTALDEKEKALKALEKQAAPVPPPAAFSEQWCREVVMNMNSIPDRWWGPRKWWVPHDLKDKKEYTDNSGLWSSLCNKFNSQCSYQAKINSLFCLQVISSLASRLSSGPTNVRLCPWTERS